MILLVIGVLDNAKNTKLEKIFLVLEKICLVLEKIFLVIFNKWLNLKYKKNIQKEKEKELKE